MAAIFQTFKFEDIVFKKKVEEKEITIKADDDNVFSFQIKDDDWSLTLKGGSEVSVKAGDNTLSVSKPDSGEFSFPKVSFTHDNKTLELPGGVGQIDSSTNISALPLTLTLNSTLTRNGEKMKVSDEVMTMVGQKRSLKSQDVIMQDPFFKNAGTSGQLFLGFLLGPQSFLFAKKITFNYGEISVTPVEDSKDEIEVKNKQTAKIEIRPYVALEELMRVITKKAADLAVAIKALNEAKEDVKEAQRQKTEEEAEQKKYDNMKTAVGVATAIVTGAGTVAACMWWNPGGWTSAAIIAEETVKITALTASMVAFGQAITLATSAAMVATTSALKIMKIWDVKVSGNDIPALQNGVKEFEKKVADMQGELHRLNGHKIHTLNGSDISMSIIDI